MTEAQKELLEAAKQLANAIRPGLSTRLRKAVSRVKEEGDTLTSIPAKLEYLSTQIDSLRDVVEDGAEQRRVAMDNQKSQLDHISAQASRVLDEVQARAGGGEGIPKPIDDFNFPVSRGWVRDVGGMLARVRELEEEQKAHDETIKELHATARKHTLQLSSLLDAATLPDNLKDDELSGLERDVVEAAAAQRHNQVWPITKELQHALAALDDAKLAEGEAGAE